jgi:hypothetical protein
MAGVRARARSWPGPESLCRAGPSAPPHAIAHGFQARGRVPGSHPSEGLATPHAVGQPRAIAPVLGGVVAYAEGWSGSGRVAVQPASLSRTLPRPGFQLVSRDAPPGESCRPRAGGGCGGNRSRCQGDASERADEVRRPERIVPFTLERRRERAEQAAVTVFTVRAPAVGRVAPPAVSEQPVCLCGGPATQAVAGTADEESR